MSRRHDQSLDPDIIMHYKAGKSISEISALVGINYYTVWDVLHKSNVEVRTKGGIYDIDNKDIISMYEQGYTAKEIANKYGVTRAAILYRLNKLGVARRHYFVNPNLDTHYFDNIDRADKAYFLGLLITDGCISTKGNRITLCLHNNDTYILRILQEAAGCSSKLYNRLDKEATVFAVSDKQWKAALAKYGVVPRKTFIATMPVLDADMMPHMIRGLIDGDGCVYKGKGRNRDAVKLTGTLQLVTAVRDYLVAQLGVNKTKPVRSRSSNIYTIGWSAKADLEKIFGYLYKDSGSYCLSRKYKKFQSIVQGNTEVSRQITKG